MRGITFVCAFALTQALALNPSAWQQAPPRAEASARDQRPPARTARIRGRVISTQGGVLRRALVRLSALELREARSTITDDQGRYEFGELPPGSYSISASKAGYLTLSYGQRLPREAPRPISVAEGEIVERLDLPLPKGSVIVVHVSDDRGEPLSGIRVTVQHYRYVNGQRQLAPVTSGPVLDTNDIGEYRAFGLAPGEYFVTAAAVASPGTPGGLSFAPAYYPGTLFPSEAQPLRLGLSQEVAVDLSMTAARPARINGVVRRSDGSPAGHTQVYLRQAVGAINPGQAINLEQDGSFVLNGVMPGDYVLDARPTGAVGYGPSEESASVPIKVTGDDISGLVVTTRRGSVLRGVVTFDTGAPSFGPGSMQVAANALDVTQNVTSSPLTNPPFSGRFQWYGDGGQWRFLVVGLAGQRVVRMTSLPAGWALKAVTIGDRDITDTVLDFDRESEIRDVVVTLTARHSEVTGQVLDSRGSAITDCTVVFFPADPDSWNSQSRLFGTSRPDRTGRFSITTLPRGRYLAAAVEYLEAGAERDSELLDELRRSATSFSISEGESRSITLRVSDR